MILFFLLPIRAQIAANSAANTCPGRTNKNIFQRLF